MVTGKITHVKNASKFVNLLRQIVQSIKCNCTTEMPEGKLIYFWEFLFELLHILQTENVFRPEQGRFYYVAWVGLNDIQF